MKRKPHKALFPARFCAFAAFPWRRRAFPSSARRPNFWKPRAAALACRRATEAQRAEILEKGRAVEECIRTGRDRTAADRAFHAAIVRAAHNEFLMRLLPLIDQAVSAALTAGEHQEQLAEDTLRDHALLMEFFQRGDAEGAEHAMAIHMRHSMDVMGLKE